MRRTRRTSSPHSSGAVRQDAPEAEDDAGDADRRQQGNIGDGAPAPLYLRDKDEVGGDQHHADADQRQHHPDQFVDLYSHSIVPGGLLVTSYTTRLIPRTSLTMRVPMRFNTSPGSSTISAVMPSSE